MKIKNLRNIIYNSLLESIDFNSLQNDAENSRGMNAGKLYKKEIQEYLKIISSKLNIKPQKFIGAGHFGFAFLSTDNKTIKITIDKSEVVESKKWMNNKPEHLPEIFNIYKIGVNNKQNDVYVIVKEYILQNKNFIKLLKDMEVSLDEALGNYYQTQQNNNVSSFFPYSIKLLFNDLVDNKITSNQILEFAQFMKEQKLSPKIMWYFQQLISLYKELNNLGLKSSDTWAKNIGLKNKKLIYLDPGDGDKIGDGWIEKQGYDAMIDEIQ